MASHGTVSCTHIRTQNAANLFEAIAASCTQFEQDYGEPVPAPQEQQQNIKMPELEPVFTPVALPANISAGAAPAERKCTQQAAVRNLRSCLEASELILDTRASAGGNEPPVLSTTTPELSFTGASPPISESAQITAETCLHPNVSVICG